MSEEQAKYVVDDIDESTDVKDIESWKIDKLLEEVKDNNADLERYQEIMDKRIEEIKAQFESKKEQILKQNHFKLTTLKEYALTQEGLRSTKTQYKLPLLSGDIIIKKSIPKPKKPSNDKIDSIAELYPELVEVEEVKKLKWADLKSKIIVQNGVPYDQETGEDLSEIVDVVANEEEVIVK